MRQNQNAKRSRGRGRRSGNSGQHSFNRNSTFESNGPEGRLRGNAQQLFEKYTSLANDAQSAGERVLFEANSQFADHYYRIHQSILANAEQKRQNDEKSHNRKASHKNDAAKEDDTSEVIQSDDSVTESPDVTATGDANGIANAQDDAAGDSQTSGDSGDENVAVAS